jgi:outer membrane protein assembly factor BamB
MRFFLLFLLFNISLITTGQQTIATSPIFQRVVLNSDEKVYDTKAWSYNTGSPVRSTVLINGSYTYFGNAAGEFYCLNKKTGQLKWKYQTGKAIHSSAISSGGRIFFSDNKQTVYALDEASGKLVWKFEMGVKKDYPWRYDYYYSSPVVKDGKLFIGGDDGFFYALNQQTGKLLWKFQCNGIVRSTAAINGSTIYFGDTEATLYAVDMKVGKELWQYKINGDTMNNEDYGFDRRAITSSPVVVDNKLIFGARDGYLYCINNSTGQPTWKVDHRVSWIISTVAVKDSFVVTGTSDGRFVQAVNLETGKEIWKQRTALAVWASPLIVNDKVYAAAFDGQLTCLDLKTGKRISQYKTDGMMMSSPVWSDNMLYVGSDDGNLYSFSGHEDKRQYKDKLDRYVYYEPGINVHYKNSSDLAVKNYLAGNGYKTINSDSLIALLSKERSSAAVIVFASCYFPKAIIVNGKESLIRKFLDGGGKIVLTGINPVVYQIDEKTKNPFDFSKHSADTIFGIDYGEGDTRSFMGQYPSFPTQKGKQLNLPDNWVTSLYIDEKKVDIVLGKNENGQVSAFVKKYLNGGQLVQLWIDTEKPGRLDAVIKAAEWQLE